MNLSQLEIRAHLGITEEKSPPNIVLSDYNRKGRFITSKPTKNDVLLGRGKPRQNWPGNQFMLALCDTYRKRYHSVERSEKNQLIDEVKSIIKARGGRFLELFESGKVGYWVEVCDKISYRKVGHAFRSNSRRLTAEKNAEIAIAEEAARTGRSFEEVLGKKKDDDIASHNMAAILKHAATHSNQEVSHIASRPVNFASPITATSPFTKATPKSESAMQLEEIEARHKLLLEEGKRLSLLEATMRSRAPGSMGITGEPTLSVGLPIHGARVDGPSRAASEELRFRQWEPTLVGQRAALGVEQAGRNASLASRFGGMYGFDPLLSRNGVPPQASIPLAPLHSSMTMMRMNPESRRMSPLVGGFSLDLPVLEEGKLVDILLKRKRLATISSLTSASDTLSRQKGHC
ncbi:hypothetical protein IV203_031569 [Nitzschia inconspicua]|uniref:DUF6824 domain-containing protein n=1 Tax=Nitzschia inconspicua TaxID=303405 RepID=A0A9K3LXB3_9STRA|nr:hypothetical protein IV203_031569 [Nitzschia inconspicua]